MDNSWPRDLALSSSSSRSTGITCGIVHGCEHADVQTLIKWLQMLIPSAGHTTFLPSLFAELQLRRHKTIVRANWRKLVALYAEIGLYEENMTDSIRDASQFGKSDYSDTTKQILRMHQDTCFLENSLTHCQRKLRQLASHVKDTAGMPSRRQMNLVTAEEARIKERLNDIVEDYDELHSKCRLITEGASILTGAVSTT